MMRFSIWSTSEPVAAAIVCRADELDQIVSSTPSIATGTPPSNAIVTVSG
jgi:hypothetical protein